ncbi:MAG: lytic transglycosylase domain-containing protein [Geminicoccaceae bacterium]
MIWSRFARSAASAAVIGCLAAMPEAEGRATIPEVFHAAAELQDIPDASILYAIAIQESGRVDQVDGMLKPWPWALNVGGEAQYYANMAEAWDALNTIFALPPRNIDIGLVQVSWPINRHVITDPFLALDPVTNLSLGARILRECFDRLGEWWQAVGCYHSPTPERASVYRGRVYRHWLKLHRIEEGGS